MNSATARSLPHCPYNYLALTLLETFGNDAPVQIQIDKVERSIAQVLQGELTSAQALKRCINHDAIARQLLKNMEIM